MERALVEYIANGLWQIPLLAGGAWLLLQMVRPQPQVQHRVWLAVLGLAVLLPLHGMPRPDAAAMQPRRGSELRIAAPEPSIASAQGHALRMHRVRLNEQTTRWLVRLYLATVVFGLLRIARSWLAARHLVARARATSLDDQNGVAFERYAQRLGIKLPQVRESAEVSSPMVLGVARPVLLLPEGFGRFTADEVRAALCHELAHVKRRDYLGNVICQLAALPIAWHPVVHAVQQRIRMTREMVCDAMAAEEMESSLRYAKSLLALAHGLLGTLHIAEPTQFPGLFGNNRLEERVIKLMDTTTVSLRIKLARIVSGAAVTMATAAMAAMFHVTPTMAATAIAPQQATQVAAAPTQAQPAEPPTEPSAPDLPITQDAKRHLIPKKQATPSAEQAQVEKERKQRMEDLRQQASRMRAIFDSPEFKRQIEEAQQQALKAKAMVDSPEFKQQIEQAQQQALKAEAMVNSPEFKRQIEQAQQQALKAEAVVNSPEFKRQIEEAQQQALKAEAVVNSPEFKRQIEEAQQQALKAEAVVNSPEFKQQMEDVERSIAEATRKLDQAAARTRKTQMQ
jgi:beta-lactamase regulating signal transducer with metallopeptidase domain/stalled ribosome alternative rescue factor ArfA